MHLGKALIFSFESILCAYFYVCVCVQAHTSIYTYNMLCEMHVFECM